MPVVALSFEARSTSGEVLPLDGELGPFFLDMATPSVSAIPHLAPVTDRVIPRIREKVH
jgi:hypothetical protein